MKAIIYFPNAPTVGIFCETFEADLPMNDFNNKEEREECRKELKQFYDHWNGEFCCHVTFDDEIQNDVF